ncbi:hypothetical protein [Crateriforma conspicua]|uniref:Uncharacterized protein n=1 Tax=Crateriforma conspicua TaxID=2527996 RepID=A0A5C5Y5A7_9PLAN|nr:hypothetical protein [Crateriforma conspicua]QDV65516.1 hypothetical protein Mal65_46870 [Crateriforma conspicua]TWT70907.1 hypothetical protein Pan14r_32150 [Crateriforma conspicua]
MPAEFNDHGLRFMYPDNWTVAQDDGSNDAQGVTLELPNGGFLAVEWTDPALTDAQVLAQVGQAMAAEYEELESESVDSADPAAPPTMEFRFYYLDLLIQSRVVLLSSRQRRMLVQIQAEDRDFIANEQVFQAILVQLQNQD